MDVPELVVAGPSTSSIDDVVGHSRSIPATVTTEPKIRSVPAHFDDNPDAVILDGDRLDTPDVAAAAARGGIPVGLFTKGSYHPGMRRGGLDDACVLLADPTHRSIVAATVALLTEPNGPFRATLIHPDGDDEWQTGYGDIALCFPEGSILVNAEDAPGWVDGATVDVVVGDRDGNLITSGTVPSPTVKHYPCAENVPRTLSFPVM